MSRAAAVAAAERGWHVFPCLPGDKRPMVAGWERAACGSPRQVCDYWPERANIGIACGPSGLVVLDLDTHGALPDAWAREPGVVDGSDVLAVRAEQAGQHWPYTRTVRTPSGGWHLYFRSVPGIEVRNSAGRAGPLVDVRAHGGYVLGAGSVVLGREYVLTDDREPAPLPAWLLRLITPAPVASPLQRGQRPAAPSGSTRLDALAARVRSAPEGERNVILNWAAFKAAELVNAGDVAQIRVTDTLHRAAEAAGLTGPEIQRTLASAMRGSR